MHLGQDASAMEEDVVLILDLSHGLRADTRDFLARLRAQGRLEDVSGGAAKSAVVLCGRRGVRALLSPVSSATLRRRQGAAGGADQLARAWDAARAD